MVEDRASALQEEIPPPPQKSKSSWPVPLSLILVTAFFTFWLMGQLARDRSWFLGLCFDIPSPAVAGITAALALRYGLRRRMALAGFALLLTVPAIGMVAFVENQWVRPTPPHVSGKTFRMMHWNVGAYEHNLKAVKREMASLQADLYVISEPIKFLIGEFAGDMGPDYTRVFMGPTLIIARGQLSGRINLAQDGGLTVDSVIWDAGPRTLKIFIVDIVSDLGTPRDPILQRLRTLMAQHQPDFVVGDFNSPRRSRALTPPPPGYVHAYDKAGSGWSYTWPAPVPMLAIDQCLVASDRILPVRHAIQSSWLSDHRRQVLDFGIVPASLPSVKAHGQPKDRESSTEFVSRKPLKALGWRQARGS